MGGKDQSEGKTDNRDTAIRYKHLIKERLTLLVHEIHEIKKK